MRQFASVTGRTSAVPHPARAQDLEMVTRFQKGHGWTVENAAHAVLDDTGDYVLGTQSARFTQPAGGPPAWIEKAGLALDLRDKVLRLWLKLSGEASDVKDITVYAGRRGFADYYKWPVATNGERVQQYVQPGQGWTVIDLGFGDATAVGSPRRADIEALRIRLNAPGGGNTSLHVNGVALYRETAAWPEGVVSICFDDGWRDNFTVARPILDAYGYPATVYAIRNLIGQPQRLTLRELHQLEDFAGWEIAGHADRLAVHEATYTGVSPEALAEDSRNLQEWLRSEGFRGANHCAYPEGAFDDSVLRTVRKYWRAARSIIQPSTEVVTPPDPYCLRAWSVATGDPPAALVNRLNGSRRGRQWCIVVFHHLVRSAPTEATDYPVADFETIVGHIAELGMPVRTVGDVLGI